MRKFVKTGIPGVDEMLGGGLPEKSVTIVSGAPGIGKTNFALQFIYNGITQYNEPGIYLTVEDTPENVREYALNFGWDLSKCEKQGKLAIISQLIYGEDEMSRWNRTLSVETLADSIKRVNAKRIVLDSITLFKYLFPDEISRRANILNFIRQVKNTGCTTIMVSEQHHTKAEGTYLDEHFIADGAILLFWSRHREKNERCFQVLKSRGTKINPDIRPMEITSRGVVVYPTQVPLSISEEK